MSNTIRSLEEAVTDPTNRSEDVLFIRKLRAIAARGSAEGGRVVATANGHGALTSLRIAPEMLDDLARLRHLVVKVVHQAVNPPPTSGFVPWVESLVQGGLERFKAHIKAVQPIHEHIAHDMSRLPEELWGLLREVDLRLGDPSLNVVSAQRGAGIDDKSILRRFRRFAGIPLIGYIHERHMETAARVAYTSDLALEDVASMLGFASADSLRDAVDSWGPVPLEEMREHWLDWDIDVVTHRWLCRGTATTEQVVKILEQAFERNPGMRAEFEKQRRALNDPD